MASGIPYFNFVVDSSGDAIAGASVAICTDGVIPPATTPCTPAANLFSDEAMTLPLANPLTTDLLGRFGTFYTTPGIYIVQVFNAFNLQPYSYKVALGSGGQSSPNITAVNLQNFGGLDSTYISSFGTPNPNNGHISAVPSPLLTPIVNPSSTEFIIIYGEGNQNVSTNTAVPAGFSVPSSAPFAVSQSLAVGAQNISYDYNGGGGGTSFAVAQTIMLFKTSGTVTTTLAVNNINLGSGSNGILQVGPFTPAAGDTLAFFFNAANGANVPTKMSAVDNQGNIWQLISLLHPDGWNGGFHHDQWTAVLVAQNVPGVSTTVTLTFDGTQGFGSLWRFNNIAGLATGSYTLQNSDNTKIVELQGGAVVTVTAPAPAFVSGWQTVVSNNTPAVAKIVAAVGVQINNGINSNVVTLNPGTSVILFSDGANYWASGTIGSPLLTGVSLTGSAGSITNTQLPTPMDFQGSATITSGPPSGSQNVGWKATLYDGSYAFGIAASTWALLTGQWFSVFGGAPANNGSNTTPDTNAVASIGTDGSLYLKGQGKRYNNITLAGAGLVSDIFQSLNTGLTANFNAGAAKTLFTPTAAAMYRISVFQAISTAATTSSTTPSLTLSYTDAGGIARTVTLITSDSTNLTTAIQQISYVIFTNGSTVVQVTSTGYASSGATAMQYELAITAEPI